MIQPLITSIDRIKELLGYYDNVDPRQMAATIITVMDIKCSQVLGTALMKSLTEKFNAGTLEGAYLELHGYVEKMVAYQVKHDGLSDSLFKVGGNTITRGVNTNVEPITMRDVAEIKQEQVYKVAHYENVVKAYLMNAGDTIFPELKDSTPEYLAPKLAPKTAAQTGITPTFTKFYSPRL